MNVLFVVPTERRLHALVGAVAADDERRRQAPGSWFTPEGVVAEAEPQQAKALLRLLIAELKVNGRAQILPTYRVVMPAVCATSEKVERTSQNANRSTIVTLDALAIATGASS